MKMKFVISLLLAAVFAVGCSKKNPQTTPTGTGTQGEVKKEGESMGGDEYGAAGGTRPAGTPQEGSDADNAPK